MADRRDPGAFALVLGGVDGGLDGVDQGRRRDAPVAVHEDDLHGPAAVPDGEHLHSAHALKQFDLRPVVGDIAAVCLGFQAFLISGQKVGVALFVFAVDQNVGQTRGAQTFHIVDREKVPLVLVAGGSGRFTQKFELAGGDLLCHDVVQGVAGIAGTDRDVHRPAVPVLEVALPDRGRGRRSEDASFLTLQGQVVAFLCVGEGTVQKVGQFDIHDCQFGGRRRDRVVDDRTFPLVDGSGHAGKAPVHDVFEGHVLIQHCRRPLFR